MLEVDSISKVFNSNGKRIIALNRISFKMDKPEILGIMGKSGAGKTTLLKIIAGLSPPSTGTVKLNSRIINRPTRSIGMVFQDYAAFPWLTIEKNISFGLEINSAPIQHIKSTVDKMLDATELTGHRKMYPKTLSGGQKQRLAIARALSVEPDVLLFDEPFGALDEETKKQMYDFIKSIWDRAPFKMIFVTHDKNDAENICHRIISISNDC